MKQQSTRLRKIRNFLINRLLRYLRIKDFGRRSVQPDYSNIRKPIQPGVSITAIFKNEANYLQEWVEYHLLIGVSHFYLYDNGSEDNSHQILKPYVTAGKVTVIPWANFEMVRNIQHFAYRHAAVNFGSQYQWMAFIDLDEFLVPSRDINLTEFLSKHSQYAVIQMPMVDFGHNGHSEYPGGLVTENYAKGCYLGDDSRVKSILQPRLVDKIETHRPHTRNPVLAIEKSPQEEWPLRLNHYFCKSVAEFNKKKARGEVQKIKKKNNNRINQKDHLYEKINQNNVKQSAIEPYLPELRKRILDDSQSANRNSEQT